MTQTKGKGDVQYVGVGTGMNSLIRPALYGAYHEIVNLTRLGKPATELVTVVGPICETGDRLGSDRLLPADEGERRAADRERRRVRLRDELALQPARAGDRSADLRSPAEPGQRSANLLRQVKSHRRREVVGGSCIACRVSMHVESRGS